MACDHPSTVVLDQCRFTSNLAADDGGGFGLAGSSAATFTDCTFESNRAAKGGAVSCWVSTPAFTRCAFLNNEAFEFGGAIDCDLGGPVIEGGIFAGNRAPTGSAIFNHNNGLVFVSSSSFFENAAGESSGSIACASAYAWIDHTIIGFDLGGSALSCEDAAAGATLECCDLYGCAAGDWVGCIADQFGGQNLNEDPEFCAPHAGDFGLCADSPCAVENNPECGTMGALGIGCAASSVASTVVPPGGLVIAPNPAWDSVRFRIPPDADPTGSARILDAAGRIIATVPLQSGRFEYEWVPSQPGRLAAGRYFLEVRAPAVRMARPFLYLP